MSEDALAETGLVTTRASTPQLASGASLGRYVIKATVGSGGMGVVYRAHDPELGRMVALKVVRPGGDGSQAESRGRLVREAQAMARVAHPNVIVVHDAGTVGEEVFVAMELVDGESLDAWERAATRTWRDVLAIYLQAARGLVAGTARRRHRRRAERPVQFLRGALSRSLRRLSVFGLDVCRARERRDRRRRGSAAADLRRSCSDRQGPRARPGPRAGGSVRIDERTA